MRKNKIREHVHGRFAHLLGMMNFGKPGKENGVFSWASDYDDGKARYIGASTIFAWQLERLQNIAERHGWTKFVSFQPQYNLIYREEECEIFPLCQDRKMAVVPWSPPAGGRCAHP